MILKTLSRFSRCNKYNIDIDNDKESISTRQETVKNVSY